MTAWAGDFTTRVESRLTTRMARWTPSVTFGCFEPPLNGCGLRWLNVAERELTRALAVDVTSGFERVLATRSAISDGPTGDPRPVERLALKEPARLE